MTRNRIAVTATVAGFAATLAVGACGSTPDPAPAPVSSSASDAPTATTSPAAGTASPATSAPPGIDPNTASETQIATALEEHGVPDARRWASAIKAHGPYTKENAMGKLSQIVQEADLNLLDMGKVNEVFAW